MAVRVGHAAACRVPPAALARRGERTARSSPGQRQVLVARAGPHFLRESLLNRTTTERMNWLTAVRRGPCERFCF